MASKSQVITKGPSKSKLWNSLSEWGCDHCHHRIEVKFTVSPNAVTQQPTIVVPVAITSLAAESGGGENWNFEGYSPRGKVRGYYNSSKRTGYIESAD